MTNRALAFICALLASGAAGAEDLYAGSEFASLAGDRSAQRVGDILTVVIYQAAEARNAAQSSSRTRRSFDGRIAGGDLDERGALSLDGAYSGEGEVRRSESFVTRMSAVVRAVEENGDLRIEGEQLVTINGETSTVRVRGLVRPDDIGAGNEVLSTRIAEAEIAYGGRGFVSRNARPNLIHRLFSLLGLGG
ncbi:MAG TPA: flagellar basal body L-ring protein FlgH [Vitreimonas sp.]|uniref:flagellar basal body L-ring protein FlgH n=1 Tax=Vitreimonas sp. TaxID=3069702 RepID=UPI002D4F142B|nr:flagellar basal body L-ring protein FlgH [Vitreimonas sp.]HYD85982.1 flagellar basal body L-ring protein FlgH [Vitreimonas sp.]